MVCTANQMVRIWPGKKTNGTLSDKINLHTVNIKYTSILNVVFRTCVKLGTCEHALRLCRHIHIYLSFDLFYRFLFRYFSRIRLKIMILLLFFPPEKNEESKTTHKFILNVDTRYNN